MTQAKPFPLNSWYAAAWSHEIKHELAARTICEKDVVIYRRTVWPFIASMRASPPAPLVFFRPS
jgi:hypothetical protein